MSVFRNTIIIVFLFAGSIFQLSAQDYNASDTISEDILFYYEKQYGVMLSNRGVGAFYNFASHKSAFRKHVWEFDFQTVKALNEFRSIHLSSIISTQTSYQLKKFVYGKSNYAYNIRCGVYINKLMNDKPYWGGVDVRYFYGGGVNLGISIPIYYQYLIDDGLDENAYVQSGRFDTELANSNIILGKDSFFKGLGEPRIHPGLHIKAGFCFDFSKYNQVIRSLDAGLIIDGMIIPFKIMHEQAGTFIIPNIFIRIGFGNKYN